MTTTNQFVTRFDRGIRERFSVARLLLIPLIVLEIGAFVAPFVYLVRISLYERSRVEFYDPGTWGFGAYADVLTNELLHDLFFVTLRIASIATVVTLAIGLFYAYALWRADGWLKTLLLIAMVLPLLTTLVVKLYAWVLLLAPLGVINEFLVNAGVIAEPLPLMSNTLGVVVGLTYTTIPYAALPIYSVLENMDWEVVEAARDLGAGRVRSFVEIVIPQAVPGIIVSTVLTLVWNFGAYAAPGLLGSGSETMLAQEIEYYLFNFDWPMAAALSIVMLAFVIVSVVVLFNLMNRYERGVDDVA